MFFDGPLVIKGNERFIPRDFKSDQDHMIVLVLAQDHHLKETKGELLISNASVERKNKIKKEGTPCTIYAKHTHTHTKAKNSLLLF